VREMLGEMVESCAPSGCRACSVCSTCTCQMLGRIVFPSTLALLFHIALVFLRASAVLLQGAYSHTEKHMRGQRMRQKTGNRASSVFASSSRQGAVVERACAAACMQAKFGWSESANEQSSRAQGGSMRQKTTGRASSVFASSSRQGTPVERTCATACIQAKFG